MKLNPAYIASLVATCGFEYDGTYTKCTITTKHDTKHSGESGCLDPRNYDREIGEQIAHKNAIEKLFAYEGYFFKKLGLAERDVDPSKVYIGGNSGDDSVCVYVMPEERNATLTMNFQPDAGNIKDQASVIETVLRNARHFPGMFRGSEGGLVGGKKDGAE